MSELGIWQTIETAPKDGTHILLWYPWTLQPRKDAPPGHMYLARWCYQDYVGEDGWIDPTDDDYIGEGATHWMPLPKPPTAHPG